MVTIQSAGHRTIKKTVSVRFKFAKLKEFLTVVELSGPVKEYNLPVFSTVRPLNSMKSALEFKSESQHTLTPNDDLKENCNPNGISAKRYDSRLTLLQLAHVLGLADYKVSMVKEIETMVIMMFDQICGFKIGDGTWGRGVNRRERQNMVTRVHRFVEVYCPTFTREMVLVIIKRGSYARTQDHLRRQRRLQQRNTRS